MEFPYVDEYGGMWLDHSGWYKERAQPCFICKKPTHRLDIDYHGYYCMSTECEDFIRKDLERANGGPE